MKIMSRKTDHYSTIFLLLHARDSKTEQKTREFLDDTCWSRIFYIVFKYEASGNKKLRSIIEVGDKYLSCESCVSLRGIPERIGCIEADVPEDCSDIFPTVTHSVGVEV